MVFVLDFRDATPHPRPPSSLKSLHWSDFYTLEAPHTGRGELPRTRHDVSPSPSKGEGLGVRVKKANGIGFEFGPEPSIRRPQPPSWGPALTLSPRTRGNVQEMDPSFRWDLRGKEVDHPFHCHPGLRSARKSIQWIDFSGEGHGNGSQSLLGTQNPRTLRSRIAFGVRDDKEGPNSNPNSSQTRISKRRSNVSKRCSNTFQRAENKQIQTHIPEIPLKTRPSKVFGENSTEGGV